MSAGGQIAAGGASCLCKLLSRQDTDVVRVLRQYHLARSTQRSCTAQKAWLRIPSVLHAASIAYLKVCSAAAVAGRIAAKGMQQQYN